MTKLAKMWEQFPSEEPGSPKPGTASSWQERREFLRNRLPHPLPGGVTDEELEAHLSSMPKHYWEQVDESDLLWGLTTVHGFLQLVAAPNVSATKPYAGYRSVPETGRTRG